MLSRSVLLTSLAAVAVSAERASFTQYTGCFRDSLACGYYIQPGYGAAVSQNVFGVGPGAGAGSGCGRCWRLTTETDSENNVLSNAGSTIVVMVTDLCPAVDPLCSQSGLEGANQYNATINFDLCTDTGAASTLFGDSGVGLAVGSALEVSCAEWSGTVVGEQAPSIDQRSEEDEVAKIKACGGSWWWWSQGYSCEYPPRK